MKSQQLYSRPILLIYGINVKYMARGVLSVSSSGRVQIDLTDGTKLLDAAAKDIRLWYSADNSWSIKVSSTRINILTLDAIDEKVQYVGWRFKRWINSSGKNVAPDKDLEKYIRYRDYPHDGRPAKVITDYESVPGIRRITLAQLSLLLVGTVFGLVIGFPGLINGPILPNYVAFLGFIVFAGILWCIHLLLDRVLGHRAAKKTAGGK